MECLRVGPGSLCRAVPPAEKGGSPANGANWKWARLKVDALTRPARRTGQEKRNGAGEHRHEQVLAEETWKNLPSVVAARSIFFASAIRPAGRRELHDEVRPLRRSCGTRRIARPVARRSRTCSAMRFERPELIKERSGGYAWSNIETL